MKKGKLKLSLDFLVFLETVYLCVSLVVVFFVKLLPADTAGLVVVNWVIFSYFFLPLLLFKNVLVSTLNKGSLTKEDKSWLLMRCSVYILLTVYSYPLILGF